MTEDPEIKAVRDARHKISARLGHDPRRILEYFTERQKRYDKEQLITFDEEPSPREKRVAAG
jgi:hypothetical protein